MCRSCDGSYSRCSYINIINYHEPDSGEWTRPASETDIDEGEPRLFSGLNTPLEKGQKGKFGGESASFEYVLESTPGMPAVKPSRIMIYRPMSGVSAQTIRVNGYGVGGTTTVVPDDVQYACHLPFVMSLLSVPADVQKAVGLHRKFTSGCTKFRGRFVTQTAAGLGSFRT